MRPLVIMTLVGVMLVAFQNCGNDVRTQGLFAEQLSESSATDENCTNSFCIKPEELLWIKIRESEPYKVNLQNINGTHFSVGGTCGTSTFSQHSVKYQIEEAFGAQEMAGTGFLDNICDLGHFQAAIQPTLKGFEIDKKYVLTLEIVGLGSGNQPISNPMPSNISRIDVIFESGLEE